MKIEYDEKGFVDRQKIMSSRRRERILRRNMDIMIRAAIIFLAGFLCGSLFTGLFTKPKQTLAENQQNISDTVYKDVSKDDTLVKSGPVAAVVVIDAGHGGDDPGSMESRIWESEINLQMALKLQEKLEAKGVQVLMTRTDNEVTLSLADRAEMANKNQADLFVSIHQNSYKSSEISGMEFFYNPYKENGGDGSKVLAEILNETVQSKGKIKSRGLMVSEDLKVLRTTDTPAVLIETGYLTNSAEEKNLLSDSYQDRLMDYIAEGIMEYLEQESGRK